MSEFIDIPWEATLVDGRLRFADRSAFDAWVKGSLAEGEVVLVSVRSLRADGYHAAAVRYYRGCVLPIIAFDYMGEPNLDKAHDAVAAQFLPLVPDGRGGLVRASTAMDQMSCQEFCDFIDRVVAWASVDLRLAIPLADRRWKIAAASAA